jgi:hypothetical protein
MARYPSDIIGDDSVMDRAETSILIDPESVSRELALQLAQVAGLNDQPDEVVGKLVKGEDARDLMNPIEFIIPIEAGLTALQELEIVEEPEEPDTDDIPRGE